MADVYTVLFISLAILTTFPALLVALNLLFPHLISSVESRLTHTPAKSLFLGVPVVCAFALGIAATASAGAGPVRALAFIGGTLAMGLGTIGAAGLARLLATRLQPISPAASPLAQFTRAAVVFELACLFPIVGWFLLLPIATVGMMGAATFALLRGVARGNPQLSAVGNQITVGQPTDQ